MPSSTSALIGQLIMPRLNVDSFTGDGEYAARIEALVREELVGGFCVFGGTPELVANTTKRLRSIAPSTSLLFSSDCEYGLPMRLTGGGTEFPDAMAIARTGEPELARRAGSAIAKEMRAVGLNWNFAPVADVNSNPDNPIINTRAFGDDPETAATFAKEFALGLQSEGVAATAKHFPGHGDTSVDSHRQLPFIDKNWDEFNAVELPPFQALIEAGVESIMTGHLAAPNLSAYIGATANEARLPATLSRTLTTELLRKRLAFGGIIITDALEMHAITKHFGPEEAAVRALQAGADVLLMPLDARATHHAVKKAIEAGKLHIEDLQESVKRIDRLRKSISIDSSVIGARQLAEYSAQHSALAQEIAEKAVELTGKIDLSDANFLIVTDERSEAVAKAKIFADLVSNDIRTAEIISIKDWHEATPEFDDNTIIVTIHRARGYVGPRETKITLPAVIREIAEGLDARGIVARGLVLLGSPYLDREFQSPPSFVLKTFSESPVSILAAVKALQSTT